MKVMGVVAEYNPFHNGHAYQLSKAKYEFDADAVIAVMSGDFVQRGEPAIIDKYSRAALAISNGADIVCELPAVAATASAEIFAEAGVATLLATGVITDLMFGCEDEEPELFRKVAGFFLEEPPAFKLSLSKNLRSGMPFAAARADAVVANWTDKSERDMLKDFLAAPNNILGIAYTRALISRDPLVWLHPIHRRGVSHDESTYSTNFASASLLRRILFQDDSHAVTRDFLDDRDKSHMVNGDSIAMFIPENEVPLINTLCARGMLIGADDISLLLHQALLYHDDISGYMDCNVDISKRILNERNNFVSFSQFADLLKTKNINHSRIRRILTHLVLGLHHEHLALLKEEDFAPYIRILGFSDAGRELLSRIKENAKVPIIVSPQEAAKNTLWNEKKDRLLSRDVYAADLYRALLTQRLGEALPTEYTRVFGK